MVKDHKNLDIPLDDVIKQGRSHKMTNKSKESNFELRKTRKKKENNFRGRNMKKRGDQRSRVIPRKKIILEGSDWRRRRGSSGRNNFSKENASKNLIVSNLSSTIKYHDLEVS